MAKSLSAALILISVCGVGCREPVSLAKESPVREAGEPYWTVEATKRYVVNCGRLFQEAIVAPERTPAVEEIRIDHASKAFLAFRTAKMEIACLDDVGVFPEVRRFMIVEIDWYVKAAAEIRDVVRSQDPTRLALSRASRAARVAVAAREGREIEPEPPSEYTRAINEILDRVERHGENRPERTEQVRLAVLARHGYDLDTREDRLTP